jgi:hypothetical protein
MFASLRNKISNYQTCSLRFDIEEKIIIDTGPELHLDVSALQISVLLLEVSATGPKLNLAVSALQRYVSNPEGPVHTYC